MTDADQLEVVATILELTHRVENPPLNRLQAITQMRNRPLHDDVTRVIQKVFGVHPLQGDVFAGLGRFVHSKQQKG